MIVIMFYYYYYHSAVIIIVGVFTGATTKLNNISSYCDVAVLFWSFPFIMLQDLQK